MEFTAIGYAGTVIVAGSIDSALVIDDEEGEVRYEIRLCPDTARLVADDIERGHPGLRLHDAEGTVGPIDGEILEVLELGTYSTGICVTIPQSDRPETFPRVDVASPNADQRSACAAVLLAAALAAEA